MRPKSENNNENRAIKTLANKKFKRKQLTLDEMIEEFNRDVSENSIKKKETKRKRK